MAAEYVSPNGVRVARLPKGNQRAVIGLVTGVSTTSSRGRPRVSTSDVVPEERGEARLGPRSLDDPGCFDDLFRRHAPSIHRYAARRLGGHLADDIVAETFDQVLKHRHSYDPARGDTLSWLWTIATNLIRRHHRSEARFYRALARTGVDPVMEGHADRVVDRVAAATVTPRLAEGPGGVAQGRSRPVVAGRLGRTDVPAGRRGAGRPRGHGPLAAEQDARQAAQGFGRGVEWMR